MYPLGPTNKSVPTSSSTNTPSLENNGKEAKIDDLNGIIKNTNWQCYSEMVDRNWEELKKMPKEEQENCYYNLVEGYRKQGMFEPFYFDRTEALCKERLPPEYVPTIYSKIAYNICKEVKEPIDARFSEELLTRAGIKDYSPIVLKVAEDYLAEGNLVKAMELLRLVNPERAVYDLYIKLAHAFDSKGDWKNSMDCFYNAGECNKAREYCITKAKNFKDDGKTKEAQDMLLASSYFYLYHPQVNQDLKDCFKNGSFKFEKAIEIIMQVKLKDKSFS